MDKQDIKLANKNLAMDSPQKTLVASNSVLNLKP